MLTWIGRDGKNRHTLVTLTIKHDWESEFSLNNKRTECEQQQQWHKTKPDREKYCQQMLMKSLSVIEFGFNYYLAVYKMKNWFF